MSTHDCEAMIFFQIISTTILWWLLKDTHLLEVEATPPVNAACMNVPYNGQALQMKA